MSADAGFRPRSDAEWPCDSRAAGELKSLSASLSQSVCCHCCTGRMVYTEAGPECWNSFDYSLLFSRPEEKIQFLPLLNEF